jgi:hypothetical protein
MPTRAEIDARERADRALRGGRAREALSLYWQLLAGVQTEGGHYEAWLDGAAAALLALGRGREAGYALIGLRRYAEAQRHFPPAERPFEWALCAGRLGRHGEAARVLSEAGHPALAAIELEEAGAAAAARMEWDRVVRDPRLTGRPYETALAHFNLGEALLRLGDRAGATRELALAERLLEGVADDFETRGERERAFDCYSVLLRLGKDTGSFENVAEGYLNGIRILAADDHVHAAQYYDDFLAYAVEQKEHYAAATLAREAADYSLKTGLPYDRHYLGRAVELWIETARANAAAGGPVELSANAFHAAIEAASSLGDLGLCGRIFGMLAELPLAEARRLRYRAKAARYEQSASPAPSPAPGFPEVLRRADTYQDVWRQDLVEWELDGDPTMVLARLVVSLPEKTTFSRLALRALLLANDPSFSTEKSQSVAELALALGRVRYYDVLRPLERLFETPAPEVRGAVMRGVSQVLCPRSFNLVRKGLGDPVPAVADEALRALRALRFRDGLNALTRIFRESSDERVRAAALDSIAGVRTPEAALVLLEAARQETGPLRQAAEKRLAEFGGDEVAALLRQARELESGERREALDRILKAIA